MPDVTLMEAVWAGNAEVLDERLKEGEEVDWGARRGDSGHLPPLHHAARHGHTAVVKLLLGAGAEVDAVNKYGSTPLHFAPGNGNGHLHIAELLLQAGADVNTVNEYGWTPLHFAAEYGSLDLAELLLQAGAEVNAVGRHGLTPLHFAAGYGNLDFAELLLQAGADVNAVDEDGWTPLRFATCGHLALVKLLCSYGATRNGEEVEKATDWGHPETAAWLTSTADYTTPLHYILPPNDLIPPPRARALLRAGADIRAARTAGGPTPLRLARQLEAEGNAPDGSTARLILRAAGPWTRETHELFPAERRAEACSLVVSIGHLHARRCKGSGYPERVDFSALVLGYAVSR